MSSSETIYKVLTHKEWASFQSEGIFIGSDMDKKDGFIHAAFKTQYSNIIKKFFKEIESLILVEINVDLLEEGCLKIESNKPGGDEYPHLYGEIPFESILSHEIIN